MRLFRHYEPVPDLAGTVPVARLVGIGVEFLPQAVDGAAQQMCGEIKAQIACGQHAATKDLVLIQMTMSNNCFALGRVYVNDG